MGVDINMSIVSKEGEYRAKDIYDGRDGEWFDNITGDYHSEFYEHFPMCRGIPEYVPDEIKRDYSAKAPLELNKIIEQKGIKFSSESKNLMYVSIP